MQSRHTRQQEEIAVMNSAAFERLLPHLHNAVMVKVWDGEPGHVSLETRRVYASLWPLQPVHAHAVLGSTVPAKETFDVVQGRLNSHEEDLNDDERRAADHQYLLLLPDVESLEYHFFQFSSQEQLHWNLLGEAFASWCFGFFDACFEKKESANCSGLAHQLLRTGGFELLVAPISFEWKKKISITGFIVIGLLMMALGKNNKGVYYTGVAIFSIGIAIPFIYYARKCYAQYCSALGRTLLGRGLVTTPEGIKKLMLLAKAKEIDHATRRLFTGPALTIFSDAAPRPLENNELSAILIVIKKLIPIIEETAFIKSNGTEAKVYDKEESSDSARWREMGNQRNLCNPFNNNKVHILRSTTITPSDIKTFIDVIIKIVWRLNEEDLNTTVNRMRSEHIFFDTEKYQAMFDEEFSYPDSYLAQLIGSDLREVYRRIELHEDPESQRQNVVLYSTRNADRNSAQQLPRHGIFLEKEEETRTFNELMKRTDAYTT